MRSTHTYTVAGTSPPSCHVCKRLGRSFDEEANPILASHGMLWRKQYYILCQRGASKIRIVTYISVGPIIRSTTYTLYRTSVLSCTDSSGIGISRAGKAMMSQASPRRPVTLVVR